MIFVSRVSAVCRSVAISGGGVFMDDGVVCVGGNIIGGGVVCETGSGLDGGDCVGGSVGGLAY